MESKSSRKSRPTLQDSAVSKLTRNTSVQTVILADRNGSSSSCPHGSNCSTSWMDQNSSSAVMATVMMGPLYILSLNGQREFDNMALKFRHFSAADPGPLKTQDRRELFRSSKSSRLKETLAKDEPNPSISTKAGIVDTVSNLQATRRACSQWKKSRSNRVEQISTSRDSTFLRRVSFIDTKNVTSIQPDSVATPKKKPPFVRKATGYCLVSPGGPSSSTPEPVVEDCGSTTEDSSETEGEEQEDILLARAMAHALEHARTKGESFIGRQQQQGQYRTEERSKAEYLTSEALARMGCVGFPVRRPTEALSQACILM